MTGSEEKILPHLSLRSDGNSPAHSKDGFKVHRYPIEQYRFFRRRLPWIWKSNGKTSIQMLWELRSTRNSVPLFQNISLMEQTLQLEFPAFAASGEFSLFYKTQFGTEWKQLLTPWDLFLPTADRHNIKWLAWMEMLTFKLKKNK